MIKAILFDMDGVLIDAKEWHYDALNRALRTMGFFISREAHLLTFDGLPTRKKLDILSKTRGLPVELHDFLNKLKQKYTMAISHNLCKPVFQHQLALRRLKSVGFRTAVCSNSIRDTVTTLMTLSELHPHLDLLIGNDDVAKPKPDPEMYATAMNKLDCLPSECLILEDNEHGIRAARASGGHLLEVVSPAAVTFTAIKRRILEIDGDGSLFNKGAL